MHGEVGVEFDIKIKDKKYQIRTNLIGKSNYGYIGVALAIVEILSFKYNDTSFAPDLKKGDIIELEYEPQSSRLSVFAGIEKSIIVDSSYNASPLSVKSVINTVHNIQKQLFSSRKIRLVLGDMREL